MTAWTLTYDCTDPAVVAEFWRTALGYVDAPPPQGFASWEAWETTLRQCFAGPELAQELVRLAELRARWEADHG